MMTHHMAQEVLSGTIQQERLAAAAAYRLHKLLRRQRRAGQVQPEGCGITSMSC